VIEGAGFTANDFYMSVSYGPVNSPELYSSSINPLTTSTALVIDTFPNAVGSGLVFTIDVAGWVITSHDKIGYPSTLPEIDRIQGCPGQQGNKTTGCNTIGELASFPLL
jgi:hypothetical protein